MAALASAANVLAERSGCPLLACPVSKDEVKWAWSRFSVCKFGISGMGQSRRFRDVSFESALTPKADIVS